MDPRSRPPIASTWTWKSPEPGEPASSARLPVQHLTRASGRPSSRATTSSPGVPHADQQLGQTVQRLHVGTQLLGRPRECGRDARSQLLLEHRHHPVPDPGPGEPWVGVVRVVPELDALGPAGVLGLLPGEAEHRGVGSSRTPGGMPAIERPPEPREPEEDRLGLVVHGVTEQHGPGVHPGRDLPRERAYLASRAAASNPLPPGSTVTRTAAVSSAPIRAICATTESACSPEPALEAVVDGHADHRAGAAPGPGTSPPTAGRGSRRLRCMRRARRGPRGAWTSVRRTASRTAATAGADPSG